MTKQPQPTWEGPDLASVPATPPPCVLGKALAALRERQFNSSRRASI